MNQQRASFPQARPQSSDSKNAQNFEQKINVGLIHNDDMDSSTDRLEGT